MGGVCPGGTKRKNVKAVEEKKNNSGNNTSGKLRSLHSIGKKRESPYRNNNGDDFRKTMPERSNSGEFLSSFSRELKPSTPARTEANKVCFMILFVMLCFFLIMFLLMSNSINCWLIFCLWFLSR